MDIQKSSQKLILDIQKSEVMSTLSKCGRKVDGMWTAQKPSNYWGFERFVHMSTLLLSFKKNIKFHYSGIRYYIVIVETPKMVGIWTDLYFWISKNRKNGEKWQKMGDFVKNTENRQLGNFCALNSVYLKI